jgi:hypothetical protein
MSEPQGIQWCCEQFRKFHVSNGTYEVGVDWVEGGKRGTLFYLSVPEDPSALTKEAVAVGIHFCPWCGANLKQHYDGDHFAYDA